MIAVRWMIEKTCDVEDENVCGKEVKMDAVECCAGGTFMAPPEYAFIAGK